MGQTTLTWNYDSPAGDGFRIYRSDAPMDPESLPSPLATVDIEDREYVDATVETGETYYYRVAVFAGADERLSAEIEHVAAISGDPHWASVTAMFYFDGADGSSTMTEEKAGRAFTRSGSGILLTTAQKAVGVSSCVFPDGQRLYASDTSLALGNTNDWTVEFFFRLNGPIVARRGLMMFGSWGTNANRTCIQVESNGVLKLYISETTELHLDTAPGAVVADTWYHAAFVRKGDVFSIFLNGVLAATTTQAKSNGMSNTQLNIGGSRYGSGALWYVDGYLDEIRVTKGVARYSATFSPPPPQYPNFAA